MKHEEIVAGGRADGEGVPLKAGELLHAQGSILAGAEAEYFDARVPPSGQAQLELCHAPLIHLDLLHVREEQRPPAPCGAHRWSSKSLTCSHLTRSLGNTTR